MDQTLEKLLRLVDAALAGDQLSADALRLVGEALLIGGGIEAMRELQGQLHDYAVEHYCAGNRGSSIGSYWEHLDEWAKL
ncbi:hypothetical protein [Azonexus sp. IMCC34839]|uniref:hypothetical protein n=1 Tax=Azonexus sp. IMCC34839 TaxID=3133695 RepID=UPI00399B0DF3